MQIRLLVSARLRGLRLPSILRRMESSWPLMRVAKALGIAAFAGTTVKALQAPLHTAWQAEERRATVEIRMPFLTGAADGHCYLPLPKISPSETYLLSYHNQCRRCTKLTPSSMGTSNRFVILLLCGVSGLSPYLCGFSNPLTWWPGALPG